MLTQHGFDFISKCRLRFAQLSYLFACEINFKYLFRCVKHFSIALLSYKILKKSQFT